MGGYLIPANSKKSMLIFNLFKKFDLILFGSGIGLSLLFLVVLPVNENILIAILAMLPAAITGFLVLPVPNYYNVRTLIISVYSFYTEKRKFIWKGWCVPHGEDKK